MSITKYTFRGYDIIGSKWVVGDLTHTMRITPTGVAPRTMVSGYEVATESVGLFADNYTTRTNLFSETEPIFEGDYIRGRLVGEKRKTPDVWHIEYHSGCFQAIRSLYHDNRDYHYVSELTDTEVLGNDYEDKNLLRNK